MNIDSVRVRAHVSAAPLQAVQGAASRRCRVQQAGRRCRQAGQGSVITGSVPGQRHKQRLSSALRRPADSTPLCSRCS